MKTKNTRILAAVLFAFVVLGGISYWIYQRIETFKVNNELSENIPPYINELFNGKSASDYPFKPQAIKWDKKYFLLDEYGDLTYNKTRNEELNTHKYFPNESINGLIIVQPKRKVLGYYKSKDSDRETTSNEAYQEYYVVNYFDLKTKTVIAKDSIWGALPKVRKSNTEDQHGMLPFAGEPNENELIETIKSRIK